jgi:cytochrome oxidase Cu insertion factor (SCO1/SenC/PrrC family)
VSPHPESGGSYTVDYSSFFYLLNPEGKFIRAIAGDVSGKELAERLRHWINKSV